MRTAVCLCGIVGGLTGKDGKGGDVPIEECFSSQKKHIFDINNSDVFIHSWSLDSADKLIELYNPQKHSFEKQIKFEYSDSTQKKRDYGYRSLSRWHSTKKSIELKKQYEIEKGFVYDCVMVMRFDLMFFSDFNFSKFDLSHLYASHWNTPQGLPKKPNIKADRINRSLDRDGFLDLWFFSNSNIMDEFTKIYEGVKRKKYSSFQHKSAWDHFVMNGYTKDFFRYAFYRHFDFEVYRWYKGFYQTYREHI